MFGGGEPGHVRAGLGNDHVRGQGADPWDRADQLAEPLKGLDHRLGSGSELVDRRGVPVDQVQMHPGVERVVLIEPPVERFGQLGDLRPKPPPCQIRQPGWVVVPGNEGFEHGPPGDTQDVRRDGGQLDASILKQLLQPLRLSGALASDRGPGPGQVSQLPDRLGRHERGLHQPVSAELSQPVASATSVLRPGTVLTCRALTSITSAAGRSSSR